MNWSSVSPSQESRGEASSSARNSAGNASSPTSKRAVPASANQKSNSASPQSSPQVLVQSVPTRMLLLIALGILEYVTRSSLRIPKRRSYDERLGLVYTYISANGRSPEVNDVFGRPSRESSGSPASDIVINVWIAADAGTGSLLMYATAQKTRKLNTREANSAARTANTY